MFRFKLWILVFAIAVCLPTTAFSHDDDPLDGQGLTPAGYGGNLPFSANRIILKSNLTLAQIGGAPGALGSAIWGWTDTAAVGGPREYAMFGLGNGTSFVDVTNASSPTYVGFLPSATGTSVWRELRSAGNHALIVSDGNGAHGMQVFDMTKLREYAGAPITFSTAESSFYTRYTGVTNAHTVHVNEATGYAYVFGSGGNPFSGGAHIVNVNNPMTPTAQGGYNGSGYIHDGQAVIYNGPDAAHVGKEILFAANARSSSNVNDDSVRIIDVTNKASISVLGNATHTNARYIHQGWLTPDQKYFLVDDELDEWYNQSVMKTHVYDVSDLENPIYKGGWTHPSNSRNIDHNLFIKQTPFGLMAFESNYTMGLRVIRIDDLSGATPLMTEWGWFDTYPANDAILSFNGQWGNYPFFDSGIIIAGDRQNGLFVLQMVPEPSTWALLAVGSLVLTVVLIRRRNKRVLATVRAS